MIRHWTDEGHGLKMCVHARRTRWERNLTNVSLFSVSLKGFKALDGGGCLCFRQQQRPAGTWGYVGVVG